MESVQCHLLILSGRDAESPVSWEFFCTQGRNNGLWTSTPLAREPYHGTVYLHFEVAAGADKK